MVNQVEVRATEVGFYNGSLISPGTVFMVPEGHKGTWFVPSTVPAPAPTPVVKDEPMTLGELAKSQSAGGKTFIEYTTKK